MKFLLKVQPFIYEIKNSVIANVPENIPVKDAIVPDNKPESVNVSGSSASSKKIIWIVAILVLLVASFAGGYYFWINKKETALVANNKEEVPKQEEIKAEEPEPENIESIPKYSSDKQNYLTIDTENPSYESLKNILIQTKT